MNLKNKTIIITGASRGIGRQMALTLAEKGANVVLAAKSVTEGKLPGTIYSVAEEVRALGAKALPVQVDVRDENQIENMVKLARETFGSIDVLINNAGAIKLTPLLETPPKQLDLMMEINTRATLVCSHYCLPDLIQSKGQIINLSPPITFKEQWFCNHTPYTITKFGMSMATIGLAEELRDKGVAVNSLWPKTLIATEAVNWITAGEGLKHSRTPHIMADAVSRLLELSEPLTGQTLIDEDFLRAQGVVDFEGYSAVAGEELWPDLFVA